MSDQFDPYREALVMETESVWSEDYDEWEPEERARVERQLHENPADATEIEYVRTHSGFCRRIIVSEADIQRLQ